MPWIHGLVSQRVASSFVAWDRESQAAYSQGIQRKARGRFEALHQRLSKSRVDQCLLTLDERAVEASNSFFIRL